LPSPVPDDGNRAWGRLEIVYVDSIALVKGIAILVIRKRWLPKADILDQIVPDHATCVDEADPDKEFVLFGGIRAVNGQIAKGEFSTDNSDDRSLPQSEIGQQSLFHIRRRLNDRPARREIHVQLLQQL
jgi:hypothetical protein